jgi:response regulator RpfG family c-di-GMP phosphodiesterase
MQFGRPTVLVVDDDSDTRCTFATWLSDAGYSCMTVEDAVMALWYARRLSPVAAIISVGHRHGWQRLASSFTHELSTTGVVLASSIQEAEQLPPLPSSVCCHVVKPSAPAEIVAAVQRASAMRREAEGVAAERHRAFAVRQQRLGDVIADARTADAAHSALRRTFGSRVPAIFAHARRVAHTAASLADALYVPGPAATHITGAALLHDIGKLVLPASILRGENALEDEDLEALGNHHARTLDLLSRAPALAPIADIVEYAQARWDGTGLPWGLAGQDIPLGARIIAVADAVDAGRSRGSQPLPVIDARYTVLTRGAGTRLDPDLVRVCLHTMDGITCS